MSRSHQRLATFLAVLWVSILAAQPCPAAAYTQDTTLTVIAGTGTPGTAPDGALAASSPLNTPAGIAAAPDGTIYLSDAGNHQVRAITPDGHLTTIAGTGHIGHPDTPIPDGTPATHVNLYTPSQLALAPDGTLYIHDTGLLAILARHPDGTLTVLTQTTWHNTNPWLSHPGGLTVDHHGTIYAGDLVHHTIRAITPNGHTTTIAGNGGHQLTAAGGPPTTIPVPDPTTLTIDANNTLWITDALVLQHLDHHTLTTITLPQPATTPHTWTTSTAPTWPPPHHPLNNVYAAAAGPHAIYAATPHTLLRLRPDATITRLATLTGQVQATIQLAVTPDGHTVLIADPNSNRIYALHPPPIPPHHHTPWWPYPTAAAAALAAIAATTITLRRKHRRR